MKMPGVARPAPILRTLGLLTLACHVSALRGQDLLENLVAGAPESSAPPPGAAADGMMLDELTVTAAAPEFPGGEPGPLAALSMQSVSVVSGETLRRQAAGTLGETLGWEPGVSSGYFGPGASRPVVRGFDGVRVRMMRDDLGTMDASDTSPDHGVALDPLLLESVEIHRGPASLLYGNSAIGGAVNSRSRVLARERLPGTSAGAFETRYHSVSTGWNTTGYATLRDGPVHLQITGSWHDHGDVRIPGRARSPAYDLLENPRIFVPGQIGETPVPNPSGRLPNSDSAGDSFSAGVSFIPETQPWHVGVAWSHFDSTYGLPYIFDGDPTDFFGDYRIGMVQDRYDIEGALELDHGFISRIDARLAYADYAHDERFIGRGNDAGRSFIDTAIGKHATEGRIDIHHRGFDDRLNGVIGFHGMREKLAASRMLIPPPTEFRVGSSFDTANTGIFVLERFELGEWTFQSGHRAEIQEITDNSLRGFGIVNEENGSSLSHSAAVTWARDGVGPLDRLAVTGTLAATRRLPTATERYAFWNNAGIGRFLIGGDLDGIPLGTEKSVGYELGVRLDRDPVGLRINVYRHDFDNFVFLQESNLTGGFGRAAQYIERPALFTGFESELDWRVFEGADGGILRLVLMADYVRGHNEGDDEPLPRMPPLRFGSRLEWSDARFSAGLEIRHATAQDRVKPAPLPELTAGSYTLVNADASWNIPLDGPELTLFLRATNLLNEEARVSTSFRKDVAPLPGRGLSVGVRCEF
jgi:iron complex outermembrane receptor protein